MATSTKTLEHFGKVQEITLNSIKVCIQGQVSCAGCQAQGFCGTADAVEKFVVVYRPNHNFIVGEEVKVVILQSMGFKALFLGYLFPFIVVVGALIALTSVGFSEGLAGLISLLLLAPYYLAIYLLRDSVSKKFNFDIQKI
jgi:sigma-E factor negative regulatory protein RseC